MRIGKLCLMLLIGAMAFSSCKKDSSDEVLIGNWKNLGDFDGPARSGSCSFTIGENTYVFGGFKGANIALNELWMYDKTKGWVQKQSLPASLGPARGFASAFAVNGKGYVGLGSNDDVPMNDFFEYDPSKTDSTAWKKIASLPAEARRNAVAVAIGNVGYVGTGYDGGTTLKDFWSYTPATNQWTKLNGYQGSKRMGASVVVHDNKFYLFGGANNVYLQKDVWCYEPAKDTWTSKTSLINTNDTEVDDKYERVLRTYGVAFLINDKIYYTGGESGNSPNRSTFEYSPDGDVWVERTSIRVGRSHAIGFSIDGKRGFMGLGFSGASRLDDFWEFFPEAENNTTDDN